MKILSLLLFLSFSILARAQELPANTEKILQGAYSRAATDNKNIFVIFHASWCVWCKKMDVSLTDDRIKKFIDANYVIEHLTVDESGEKAKFMNPGADEFRKKFHGENAGLPFWIILDSKGKLLADSYTRQPGQSISEPGNNIGCPATEEEVNAFINILRNTSSLTSAQLTLIYNRFRKNEVKR